jgi:hypothetical protein
MLPVLFLDNVARSLTLRLGLDRMARWRYISGRRAEEDQRQAMHAETATLLDEARLDFSPGEGYLSSLREAFGAERVALSIGPVRMSLEGLASAQAERLRSRFQPFVTEIAADADVGIRLRRAGVGAFLKLPSDGSAETYRLETRRWGSLTDVWSYEFAGRIEPARRRATLALVSAEGELFDRGLENFLRILTAYFILERGGFLLHGSGIVRGDRAYVFFGPSGSGKTTVTDLSPGDTVLSDDLTLVVRHRDRYEAAGIPFGMAHHRVPETRASFTIASLNRLVQSPDVKRERLAGARALAEVAGSLPFVMQEQNQASRAMDVVANALEQIPVYRLEFRRDDGFWKVVEEAP